MLGGNLEFSCAKYIPCLEDQKSHFCRVDPANNMEPSMHEIDTKQVELLITGLEHVNI